MVRVECEAADDCEEALVHRELNESRYLRPLRVSRAVVERLGHVGAGDLRASPRIHLCTTRERLGPRAQRLLVRSLVDQAPSSRNDLTLGIREAPYAADERRDRFVRLRLTCFGDASV
jgi:hypothetical protein